jgi:hypothetical protein
MTILRPCLRAGLLPADTRKVILVVVFGLGLLTIPLAGGRLGALAEVRPRRWPVLAAAVLVQLAALKAPLPRDVAVALNGFSYVLGGWYVGANRSLLGLGLRLGLRRRAGARAGAGLGGWLVVAGGAANGLALAVNGGVMPASQRALAAAGLSTGLSSGVGVDAAGSFVNSALVPGARLAFLGDVFAVPRSWPLANVFSVGDVLLLIGALLVAHRLCRSRSVAVGQVDDAEQFLPRHETADVLGDAGAQAGHGQRVRAGAMGRDDAVRGTP